MTFSLLTLSLPGRPEEPAGVLVYDAPQERLAVKLRRDWQTQEVQKLEVELVSGLPKNIVGAAGIVVGSGPSALMLRAAWTTFNILIRWRFPYGLHRGPGEAALWLAAVLAKAGADCPESAALVEACVAVADIRDAA